MAYNPYLTNPYLQPAYLQPYQTQPQQPVPQPVQQMPMQQPVVPQPQQTNMIWVENEAAAKAYPIAPGNTVILMDNDNPVAYKKSADMTGRAMPLEIYDLVKREQKEEQPEEYHQMNLEEYVTKKEFDKYASNMEKKIAAIESVRQDDTEDPEDEEDDHPVRKKVKNGKR